MAHSRRKNDKREREENVLDPAFPPAVVVLLEGADRALRERHAVHTEPGQSRRSRRACGADKALADLPVSGAEDKARGEVVPESSIIIEYLDRHYPGRTRFIPEEKDRGLETRLRDRFYDLYVHLPMQKAIGDRLRSAGNKDPHGVEEARAQLRKSYAIIDRQMESGGWAMGSDFSLADCAAMPSLYYDYGNRVEPVGEFRNVSAYLERLQARPSFARVLKEAEPYFGLFPTAAE